MEGLKIMVGENFKRFHATKENPLKEKLKRLENKRNKLWDDFVKWCSDNPNGGTQPINYEQKLKDISFEIENIKYLMGI